MNKFIDMAGQTLKSGSKVIERISDTKPVKWKCECICLALFIKRGSELRDGKDMCPVCLMLRGDEVRKKKVKAQFNKRNTFKKGQKCAEKGCRKIARADCDLDGKHYCRDHYIGDFEYPASNLHSTLAAYI